MKFTTKMENHIMAKDQIGGGIIMENQMEHNMEHEMETGFIQRLHLVSWE